MFMVSGKNSHQSLRNCKVHFLELAWRSSLPTGTPTTSPGQAQHGLRHVSPRQEAYPDPRALARTMWFSYRIFASIKRKIMSLTAPL